MENFLDSSTLRCIYLSRLLAHERCFSVPGWCLWALSFSFLSKGFSLLLFSEHLFPFALFWSFPLALYFSFSMNLKVSTFVILMREAVDHNMNITNKKEGTHLSQLGLLSQNYHRLSGLNRENIWFSHFWRLGCPRSKFQQTVREQPFSAHVAEREKVWGEMLWSLSY